MEMEVQSTYIDLKAMYCWGGGGGGVNINKTILDR